MRSGAGPLPRRDAAPCWLWVSSLSVGRKGSPEVPAHGWGRMATSRHPVISTCSFSIAVPSHNPFRPLHQPPLGKSSDGSSSPQADWRVRVLAQFLPLISYTVTISYILSSATGGRTDEKENASLKYCAVRPPLPGHATAAGALLSGNGPRLRSGLTTVLFQRPQVFTN